MFYESKWETASTAGKLLLRLFTFLLLQEQSLRAVLLVKPLKKPVKKIKLSYRQVRVINDVFITKF